MAYRIHPLADLFPPMQGKAFEDLKADIRARGLLNRIVVHDGLILDGRNRLRACEEVGRPPYFEEFSNLKLSCSPEAFIWSQNIHRRHLTEDQRAVLTVQWGEHLAAAGRERQREGGKIAGRGRLKKVGLNPGQPKRRAKKTSEQLAESAKVSRHKIEQAAKVAKAAPELASQVTAGTMPLKVAVKQVEAKREPLKMVTVSVGQMKARPPLTPDKPVNGDRDIPKRVLGSVKKILERLPSTRRGDLLDRIIDCLVALRKSLPEADAQRDRKLKQIGQQVGHELTAALAHVVEPQG